MAGKATKKIRTIETNTPSEQFRRVWLAGLGAFSLTRKHSGQWFGRFADDGREAAARAAQFARETVADTQAHAVGVLTPITARVEKRIEAYAGTVESGVEPVLARFGIPSKREIEDLSRQVAALSRKLKAAK